MQSIIKKAAGLALFSLVSTAVHAGEPVIPRDAKIESQVEKTLSRLT